MTSPPPVSVDPNVPACIAQVPPKAGNQRPVGRCTCLRLRPQAPRRAPATWGRRRCDTALRGRSKAKSQMTPGIPQSLPSLSSYGSLPLSLFPPVLLPLPRDICLSLLQKQAQHLILGERPSVPALVSSCSGAWVGSGICWVFLLPGPHLQGL